MQRRVVPVALAAALAIGGAHAARAEAGASDWSDTEHVKVRLIAASTAVGGQATLDAGLQFVMDEGWKIYWRAPGDAGFPPSVDWNASRNLRAAEIAWPAPERFSILGFETFGYKGEVVLPVAAALAETGRPLRLQGEVRFLACNEVCIPEEATLALEIASGPAASSRFARLIGRFAERVPRDGARHGLAIERAEADGAVLRIEASASLPFVAPDVFVEGPREFDFRKPAVALSQGGRRAVLRVAVGGRPDSAAGLVGTRLTFTLVDGERSAERSLGVAASAPAGGVSYAAILGLALLGGLILNLMPCVLPVLSLKLIGVVGHGGGERRRVRIDFLATAAGIVASFLVLAAALALLKHLGATVGWGIQFQQPWFLVAMALVVVGFALNLGGAFEIRLPRWIADAGERAIHVHGVGGSFLTGAFATLLATPCSAPFLGTAIGFALTRGVGDILAIFAVLGIGLALPYLVVAAAPALATALPRPGRWMVWLKRVLALALVATAGWLASVLFAQVGGPATWAAVVAIALAAALVWLRPRLAGWGRRYAFGAVVAAAVAAFASPTLLARGHPVEPLAAASDDLWRPFDESAIPALVAQGRIVFVDVTADWCITCRVNKGVVLERGEVYARLKSTDVVAMRADWTQPSDTIAGYLAGFGRFGIPFDAVYGPRAPAGIVLPELLSKETVLSALDRAAGGATAAASIR